MCRAWTFFSLSQKIGSFVISRDCGRWLPDRFRLVVLRCSQTVVSFRQERKLSSLIGSQSLDDSVSVFLLLNRYQTSGHSLQTKPGPLGCAFGHFLRDARVDAVKALVNI